MKIYDEALENELTNPDLTKGKLVDAQKFVAHHEATEEVWHYEVMQSTITEACPDGLRLAVTDEPAHDAWDEYETVQKYVLYTKEELAEIAKKQEEANKPTTEQRLDSIEKRADALESANDDIILMMADLIGGEG